MLECILDLCMNRRVGCKVAEDSRHNDQQNQTMEVDCINSTEFEKDCRYFFRI